MSIGASLWTPVISVIGGGGSVAAMAKKLGGKPKRHFMVVPYGHVAYITRFNNPVPTRAVRKAVGGDHGKIEAIGENYITLGARQFKRIPLLHRLTGIDMRPQRHLLPPMRVTLQNGLVYELTVVLSYRVEDGFKALFAVEDWHRFLVEGCLQIISTTSAELSSDGYLKELRRQALPSIKEVGRNCGIDVEGFGFKDGSPDAFGQMVMGQKALYEAKADGLNLAYYRLTPKLRSNALLTAALGGTALAGMSGERASVPINGTYGDSQSNGVTALQNGTDTGDAG